MPAVSSDPLPEQIAGYQVGDRLGSGSFGEVVAASRGDEEVASKILYARHSGDAKIRSRFTTEARAGQAVHHPGVVRVLRDGVLEDGRPFLVMERLEGETLEQRLAREGRLSLEEALPILSGIADALDACHDAGIVHRDVKPGNVFLAQTGSALVPKLFDFGVAKIMTPEIARTHQTRAGSAIGTPVYMAPEQSAGREVGPPSDIYALGVLAYEVLTGGPPFRGRTEPDLVHQHAAVAPEAPSRRTPLPESVDRALLLALEKDPAHRPASAAELVLELTAEPAPALPRARWELGVALSVLLAVAALAWYRWGG